MHRKRYILKNNNGISTVLETLVTVAISLSLLIIFFVSVNNIYRTHDRPDADVEAKSIGVMEALTNNPGLSSGYNLNWEDNPENASFAGLGTTPTIAYGIATGINQITGGEEVTFKEYHLFPDTRLGIATTCFLAGTKIVMADGTYRNIEDIKVGDNVKSFDEKTDKIVDKKVTNIFHHPAEDMTPYYLIINKCLRITPNHQMYSDGRWLFAGDLKIGDCLFSPGYNYKIYSIEKIFKMEPTYNFEVDGNHNYFVALDDKDALVHNPIPKIYPRFTWFDSDGAYNPGATITFNAEESESEFGPIDSYEWDFDGDGVYDLSTPLFYAYKVYPPNDNSPHNVTLKVNSNSHNAKVNHIVQANTPDIPEPDVLPWALTGKNIYPSSTLAPYAGGYYVDYEELNDGNYFFEIKEKTNAPTPILDFQKIENLPYVMYPVVKTALGLDTSEWVVYNFNIMVTSINKGIICNYGSSYENAEILKSTEKDVLIYYKPEVDKEKSEISAPPYYEKGRITIRVFIGGIPPNYPPYQPYGEDPKNETINVPWTVSLHWKCYDPDGDPLKYDVYFKENDGDFDNGDIVSHNQTGSSYTPDIIEGKTYWWQIVAWDTRQNCTKGPKWTFRMWENHAPFAPDDESPENGGGDVEVYETNLSWTGDDQDLGHGDSLTYDVHFGDNPLIIPKKVVANQTDSYYICSGRLDYNRNYYWRIRAWDHPPSGNNQNQYSDIWQFTTKEKGLDQKNIISSGSDPPPDYNTKDHEGLGQRFIIGSPLGGTSGNERYLTKINLSLKYYPNGLSETPPKIWVQIYSISDFFTCNPNTPGGRKNVRAQGNITGFTDINFGWRTAILDKPLKVKSSEYYVVVIPKILTLGGKYYGWQYNEESMTPSGYYPRGEPWQYTSLNSTWWRFPISQDFLFKTYVIRIPFLNESSTMHSRYSDQSTRFELAQTFKAHYTGDLMKVNLSLNWSRVNPNQPSNLTVEIYQGNSLGSGELGKLIATCTIKGFNSTGFVWKEATFYDNPPYLEAGENYTIVLKVLNQGPQTSQYRWEKSDPSFDYRDGSAWVNIGGSNWKPIDMSNPSLDFIFGTYMDQVG